MNQAKRQLSIDMSMKDDTKKLRTFNENRLITHIEDLSNELFYEIFDYFDSCEIYNIFSNLNQRFHNLINQSNLPLKFYHDNKSKQLFEYNCLHVITPNKHRIISLYISDRLQLMKFFTLYNIDLSFQRLESIYFYGIKSNEIVSLLPHLTILPRLLSLNICLDDALTDFNEIYRLIFLLSILKYNKISARKITLQDSISINSNEQFNSLEHLIIDHPCTLYRLYHILSYTQNLRYLTCVNLFQWNEDIYKQIPLKSFNLIYCSIHICDLKFDQFEIFIKQISSQLQILHFKPSSDITYLDADRWERLILQYIPYLKIFQFEYHDAIFGHFEIQSYHLFINRFTSPFWIERQWIFSIQTDLNYWPPIETIFSIQPNKKQWYELLNQINDSTITEYEHMDVSKVISQLTIQNCSLIKYDQSFTNYIQLISSMAQISYLHIVFNYFSIDILVQFLHLLPHLDTLTINFMSSNQLTNLNEEYINVIHYISTMNKITKINIEHMIDLNYIDIIIHLFPQMEYLQIECKNSIDLERIIYLILIKRKSNLHLLCLRIPQADDLMIKKLQMIINLQRLLINYTIQRISDRIYLQWQKQG